MFRTFLGSLEIEAFLYDEYIVQLFWHYSNTIGGVRVVVNEADEAPAREAHATYMAALRAGPYPLNSVRAWPVVLAMSLLFGAPLLAFGRRFFRR